MLSPVAVTDILDVRRGWKTDTFNRFGDKVVGEQRKHKLRRLRRMGSAEQGGAGQAEDAVKPLVDEACCFSVVYGDRRSTLDLVANSPQVAALWVRGLRHIVTVLRGLNQEKRLNMYVMSTLQRSATTVKKIRKFTTIH